MDGGFGSGSLAYHSLPGSRLTSGDAQQNSPHENEHMI